MPPPPCLHNPNATIILKFYNYVIRKNIPKFEKSFPLVCRACQAKAFDMQ